jgi:DNA-binding transcriptional MocR family regulator
VRQTARRLGLSPATVAAAYRALRDRGVVTTRGRLGTAVSPRPPLRTHAARALPAHARDLASGNPDPALLPDLRRALGSLELPTRVYGQEVGYAPLLAHARRSLARDGVAVPELTVTSGALDAIERALLAHLRPGDRVAVEDPGFVGVLDLLPALGLVPVPVALDERGPLPDSVEAALEEDARALIVTPRAQNPTGAAIDAARARELVRVLAAHRELLLIEDDHAAGAAGVPLHTLCTSAVRRFAFTRSFSKTLGPDLRVAVLAGDPETIARVEGRQIVGMRWVSHVLQRLVHALVLDRAVRAGLREAARLYARRREALVAALAREGVAAWGRSGFNLWVPVREEAAAVARLLEEGYAVAAGERFRVQSGPGLRVTTAALEEREAPAAAAALARALRPAARSSAA